MLPASVQKQVDATEEILKQVYGKEDPENPANEPATPAENEDPNSAQPAENPAEEPAKEPAKEPVNEDPAEHKFKVLQGKYDKEVPRLHRQLRDATTVNGQLNNRVADLEAEVKRLNEAPTPAPANPLSQDEIDQFGPDLIDIIRRVAQAETGVVLDDKLKPVRETVKQVQEKVAHDDEDEVESTRRQMLIDLASAVPDWETQNEDEKFLTWLDETDPMSGKQRMENLAEAYKKCDAETVINIFKGFQKENAIVNPEDEPSDETPEETPAPDEQTPEQPLEDLVAPGTPKTGSTGAQNESGKRVWTQAEIKEFYAYKNEFIKKNAEAELPEKVVLLERDIFAAQSEGRIKP